MLPFHFFLVLFAKYIGETRRYSLLKLSQHTILLKLPPPGSQWPNETHLKDFYFNLIIPDSPATHGSSTSPLKMIFLGFQNGVLWICLLSRQNSLFLRPLAPQIQIFYKILTLSLFFLSEFSPQVVLFTVNIISMQTTPK